MNGPPDWLVSLVPWLGHRRSRRAWQEVFEDSISLSVVFATSLGKWIESSVAIFIVGDPTQWPFWWAWAGLTVTSFVLIVFSYHLKQLAGEAAEKATDAAENLTDD